MWLCLFKGALMVGFPDFPRKFQDVENSIDNFILKSDSFIINNLGYENENKYDQVRSIFVERKRYVSNIFLKSHAKREVTMQVRFASNSILVFNLRENGPRVFATERDFTLFEERYKKLLERTFQYRIKQYQDSIDLSGKFNLYGIMFYIGDRLQNSSTVIHKENVETVIKDNQIQILSRADKSLLRKPIFRIPLNVDPDIVYSLIEYFKKTKHKPNLLSDTITRGSVLFGKYIVVNKLGEGAFGEVFRVRHVDLNAERAVKLILPIKKKIDSTQLNFYASKFKQEAQIGASLESPYVVRVYDFEAFPNGLALVMEDVKGNNLDEKIKEAVGKSKYIPFSECLQIFKDCLKGLSVLHSKGYVHRDVKPANILLDASSHAKISDLGIAQTPLESQNWNISSRHPGTILYMSPEQKKSEGPLSPSSDIFSLGLTLFELLFLRPWKDVVVNRIYLQLRNDIPNWFYRILIKMVAKDLDTRPKSCQAVLQMIEENESQIPSQSVEIMTRYISYSSNSNIPMVFVPEGPVEIGTASDISTGSAEDSPKHIVSLKSFWISKYPICIIEFYEFMRETNYVTTAEKQGFGIVAELAKDGIKFVKVKGANWLQPYGPSTLYHYSPHQPVTAVSWLDAIEYCNWLSQKIKTPVRLPTEVEWEKAAHGKDNSEWPWGAQFIDPLKCNYSNHIGMITPSNMYSPESDSRYGCADMLGNIWDWTQSAFRPYPYNMSDGREEYNLTEKRVLRGGSLIHYPSIRHRDADPPDSVFYNDGFRIVIEKF
jgi:serine/threonine protein kinase